MHSVEPGLEPLELGDPLVDPRGPACCESRDQSRRFGARSGGSLASSDADLLQRQADPLGEDDERDPAQHRPADSGGGPSRRART